MPVSDRDKAKDPVEIFRIIHEYFKSNGILRSGVLDSSTEQIRHDILDAFKSDPQLQVLAMLDESDAFLHSDSSAGSVAVESMRSLMDSTDSRFKVVFAGLHNVQRFAQMPNNPFPNLGFDANRPRRGRNRTPPLPRSQTVDRGAFWLVGF